MRFPDKVQSALLFDRDGLSLDAIHKSIVISDLVATGAQYKNIEYKPGFFRLFSNDNLTVTVEYLDRPADPAVFRQALGSFFNRVLCPDAEDRIRRHRSHILIEVSHGLLPGQMKSVMASMGLPPEGASLPQFQARLTKLAYLSALVQREVPPTLVHWTLSNQIFSPELFRNAAIGPAPGPLHIHPVLFGDAQNSMGPRMAGIRTFGARHFIGRELLIEPNPIPWQATFLTMLAFLKVATVPDGYVIPDGDLLENEDYSEAYRIHHRSADEGDVPLYEFEPMLHQASGFRSPAYVSRESRFDDRNIPANVMPEDRAGQDAMRAELRGKRRQAELVGNHFEVRVKSPDGDGRPPAPLWFPTRPVFGRKKPGT
jgi:hypothetical protein